MKKALTALLLGCVLLLSACGEGGAPQGSKSAGSEGAQNVSAVSSETGSKAPVLDITSVETGNGDLSQQALEASFTAEGNLARMAKLMKKARQGEKVVLGFLGGSITEGMSASNMAGRYASQVLLWFRAQYPEGEFELVNAGIGSTGSIIGGGRMEEDLFSKKPDLIVVEFACNDGVSPLEQEAYEGVVRRALSASNQPAVMLLFMTRQDYGSSQDAEIPVGRKYGLPMISYRDAVKHAIETEKRFAWKDIAPDAVHPNDRGHAITARLITHRLELVRNNLDGISAEIPPLPDSGTRFAAQTLRSSQNYTPKVLGSFAPAEKQYANASLSRGWTSSAAGGALEFTTSSQVVTLVFKRMVIQRGAKLNVIIGGQQVMTLDADFQGGFGEYADLKTIIDRKESTLLNVQLQIDPSSPQGSVFMLLGIIE